ncbi:hypothetical protein [Owariibacterium komagatae]|uniref:hypothetical protein n=1 Tax=Owariibacterium komagatae TaxID=3136601 RepID=UPI0038B342BA
MGAVVAFCAQSTNAVKRFWGAGIKTFMVKYARILISKKRINDKSAQSAFGREARVPHSESCCEPIKEEGYSWIKRKS